MSKDRDRDRGRLREEIEDAEQDVEDAEGFLSSKKQEWEERFGEPYAD